MVAVVIMIVLCFIGGFLVGSVGQGGREVVLVYVLPMSDSADPATDFRSSLVAPSECQCDSPFVPNDPNMPNGPKRLHLPRDRGLKKTEWW